MQQAVMVRQAKKGIYTKINIMKAFKNKPLEK